MFIHIMSICLLLLPIIVAVMLPHSLLLSKIIDFIQSQQNFIVVWSKLVSIIYHVQRLIHNDLIQHQKPEVEATVNNKIRDSFVARTLDGNKGSAYVAKQFNRIGQACKLSNCKVANTEVNGNHDVGKVIVQNIDKMNHGPWSKKYEDALIPHTFPTCQNTDYPKQTENENPYALVPGMVLQVFQGSFESNEFKFFNTQENSYSDESINVYTSPCYVLHDNEGKEVEVTEYILLEQLHSDLGLIEHHKLDYAYHPVVAVSTFRHQNLGWMWDQHSYAESMYERSGERAFAGGSHGEVWRARRKCNNIATFSQIKDGTNIPFSSVLCEQDLIMKRLKVEQGVPILEAGLREIYFGDILSRNSVESGLFTKYIDHFFHKSPNDLNAELWIVFENAGPSLRSLIYTPVESNGFVVYQHSSFWRWLRLGRAAYIGNSVALISDTEPKTNIHTATNQKDQHSSSQRRKGMKTEQTLLKKILKQILVSAAKLHERGIIHRDIKPSNIMCKLPQQNEPSDLKPWSTEFDDISCVLGDLSSAWDVFSSENLYSEGPSVDEQTDEYAPPEALFGGDKTPFYETKPESFDSWSIGIVALELLLGTPNVFTVDQRTKSVLCNRMEREGASVEDIRRALYLAALSQFCIYLPKAESGLWPLREGDPLFKASIVKTKCTIQDFHNALRARDPLGLGFDSSYDPLLQLIWDLLSWDPKQRITPREALDHFYFEESHQESTNSQKKALESQILDPRLDINIGEHTVNEFICPKCGRKFDNLHSCQLHATGRKHAKFCTYDRSLLPPCLNAHSMLPAHPTSGYCDIQGRRRVIEDFHTVHLHKAHQFYGVFDGHNGNLASKFAAGALYKRLAGRMDDVDEDMALGHDWKREVSEEVILSFRELHEGILNAVKAYPGGFMSKSGTTATILFVTEKAVVIANVGDSRAILSVTASYDMMQNVSAIALTTDHVASNEDERKSIEQKGGIISNSGGIPRVNGTLALSRSLGDAHLAHFLSQTPDVFAMTREEMKMKCRLQNENDLIEQFVPEVPCFIVLASDGLWDVLSNQEAVELVLQTIQKYPSYGGRWDEAEAFQEAAEVLTQEAYVRGSSDNIGVCVVAI